MKMLARFHWILAEQFGLDLRKLLGALFGLPRYVRHGLRFRRGFKGRIELRPCLHDWGKEGGTTRSEYFWQDLLVARRIAAAQPETHVDVGSRVDGFVAHVAAFREIEVVDIRPVTTKIPGVRFRQADLMSDRTEMHGCCDSLSCLHALEHFGLGRYGDPVDPRGYEQGLQNMARLLRIQGIFYLSVPIGIERVEFNAHRVFDPRTIVQLATRQSLQLLSLTVIHPGGKVEETLTTSENMERLCKQRYALGIFQFIKLDKSLLCT